MPVAAIPAIVAVSEAVATSVAFEAIGTAVAAAGLEGLAATAVTVAADVATGAAIGAVGSAIQGGDVGQGALFGGISAGIQDGLNLPGVTGSTQIGGFMEPVVSIPDPSITQQLAGAIGDTGASRALSNALASGATKFATTTGLGLLQGAKPGQALEMGALSGGGAGLMSYLNEGQPQSTGEKLAQAAAGTAVSDLLKGVFSSTTPTTGAVTETGGILKSAGETAPGGAATTTSGMSPTGGPYLGTGEDQTKKSPTWNISSLRTTEGTPDAQTS
jgi:hypothetical protein